MKNTFSENLAEHLELFSRIGSISNDIALASELIVSSLQSDKKLMLCGNGGSAADSQHIASELTGRFVKDRRPLAAIALSTDSSALTCIGNDNSFEDIFCRQMIALGHAGDCIMDISTSGNSRNLVKAVEVARTMGIKTIGLLGHNGGALRAICDVSIIVPSSTTARIQEAHIFVGHTLYGLIEESLGLD